MPSVITYPEWMDQVWQPRHVRHAEQNKRARSRHSHLAELVQLALAVRLMAVAVSPVPVSLVLRSRDTWQRDAVIQHPAEGRQATVLQGRVHLQSRLLTVMAAAA